MAIIPQISEAQADEQATRTQALGSSWLKSVTYDLRDGTASVTFRDGFVWQGNLSRDQYESLVTTNSAGRWWHDNMM